MAFETDAEREIVRLVRVGVSSNDADGVRDSEALGALDRLIVVGGDAEALPELERETDALCVAESEDVLDREALSCFVDDELIEILLLTSRDRDRVIDRESVSSTVGLRDDSEDMDIVPLVLRNLTIDFACFGNSQISSKTNTPPENLSAVVGVTTS